VSLVAVDITPIAKAMADLAAAVNELEEQMNMLKAENATLKQMIRAQENAKRINDGTR
jgi:prefoldin subunit 5